MSVLSGRVYRFLRMVLASETCGWQLVSLNSIIQTTEAYLKGVHLLLTGSVGDLAVVDDDGVAASTALVISPADALGELGLGVREEEL